MPTQALANSTLWEMWTGEKPSTAHLQEFEVPVWVYLKLHPDKMRSRAWQYIFTGFADKAGAICYYDTSTQKIKISRNFYFQHSDPALAKDDDGPMSLLLGGRYQGEARALMGMEAWVRAWWEKMRMRTGKDPSTKDTAHWIPANLSEPIA